MDILDQIDSACEDWSVSADAMRSNASAPSMDLVGRVYVSTTTDDWDYIGYTSEPPEVLRADRHLDHVHVQIDTERDGFQSDVVRVRFSDIPDRHFTVLREILEDCQIDALGLIRREMMRGLTSVDPRPTLTPDP